MKKVINGKIYNTETAEEIGSASGKYSPGDFRFWSETLYRTSKGTYFLAGRGGPMSHWSQPAFGGGSTGGEGLRVLEDPEAQEWAERYLDTESYLKQFEAEEA